MTTLPQNNDDTRLAASIGHAIAARRRALGLTQRKFAEMIGLGETAVSRIETGERGVTAQRLQKICVALNCSVDELLQRDSKTNRESDRLAAIEAATRNLTDDEVQAISRIVQAAADVFRQQRDALKAKPVKAARKKSV